MRTLLIAATVAIACPFSFADEASKVEISSPAPDFTATGIDGKAFKLSDKLKSGKKNVVLIFSRAHWCPFCMKQLAHLQQHADEFEALNAEVIVIFREEKDGTDGLTKIKNGTKTTFTLALDLDKKSSKAYSPKHRTFDNFVIDKDGNVAAVIDGTLRDRVTADKLLKALKKIEQKDSAK
ncbi:peroxiredoxin family protein [Fuerstiella marisgermanici]|uniref:Thiol-disulfide oxidoreductase ResA n=1 Tax=Fuerstiella marisgermanici TaxID=1891926 RepID=A0A1P8W9I0_9PLAN|nr:redoxin domain-containing protein [Fuerstiella marisgermanici]APZ90723.1 Thiol-disulfide oxidoreductase ResA [Fuerstiella marisgermanici]